MKNGVNGKIPQHVAIIMDGNRRWAAKKGLPSFAGHKRVVDEVVEELVDFAGEKGIGYITLWAWSSENWRRPDREVTAVMKLFRYALEKKVARLIRKGARVRVIGDIGGFPEDIQKGLMKMVEESRENTGINVTFALNYGGRDELLRAIPKLAKEIPNSKLQMPNGSKVDLGRYLDTAGMPDPDLIIRPGGTKRLSGFMLWQCEYSELYFTDTLMPDFDKSELAKALEEYGRRERRFGGGGFGDYKG